MKPNYRLPLALVALAGMTSPVLGQITVQPPYNTNYSFIDLGSAPGVPAGYGGLTFKAGDPDALLLAGASSGTSGNLYSIGVLRDTDRHITNFNGTATFFAQAAYNDGGVAYGPGGVLFLARWPVNELGQTKPGSTNTDKIISLSALGVTSSPGGLNFVPAGFTNENQLKICGFGNGQFYTARLAPDGLGTYDITSLIPETQISGGPEGFIYPPPGSPCFADYDTILVSEFSAGIISVYRLTTNSTPRPETRSVFISGLAGAEGATRDPVTGDFLFSTFGAGNHVIVVRGFNMPPAVALTSPTNNSVFTACVPFSLVAAASDLDGTVESVEFFQDTNKLGEVHSGPYRFSGSIRQVGAFTFTARATDNGGAVTVSDPVTISFVPPPQDYVVLGPFTSGNPLCCCSSGQTGITYSIEATTEFRTWTNLGPMSFSNGLLEFLDTNAAQFPKRFYRAVHSE